MALRMNTILEGLEILQLHVVWFFEQKGLLLNIYRSGGRSKNQRPSTDPPPLALHPLPVSLI